MAYKMKGSTFYGKSPFKQDKKYNYTVVDTDQSKKQEKTDKDKAKENFYKRIEKLDSKSHEKFHKAIKGKSSPAKQDKKKKTIQLSSNEEAERKVIKKRTDAVENARKQAEAAIEAHKKAVSQYEHTTDSVNTVAINERKRELEAELAEINKKEKKKKKK